MKNISVSVVIPNYNGKELLKTNLPSVFSTLNNAEISNEIIIVDDCSTDDSLEFITHNYPQIIIVKREVNGGFSAACNSGLAIVKHNYILFLNSDIKLTPNYFDGQFDYFKHEDTFGVMAKIKGIRDGEIHDTARLFTKSGFKIKANTFFYVKDSVKEIPTAYLSGANALIDADKMKELGGFDEIFSPFYYEDFELGLRAWRLGWKCFYHPRTYCIHDHSSTTKNYKTAQWVKSIFFRNRFIMHAIHLCDYEKRMWKLQLLFGLSFSWITGKSYMYNAYKMYLTKKNEIKNSKEKFEILMHKYHSFLSINDVQSKITGLLKDVNIKYGRQ